METSSELNFRVSVLFHLTNIPLQILQLERLEPKEAEVCAGMVGSFGFRGHITTQEGTTCRFVVWAFPFQDNESVWQGENVRYGWVLRGANAPEQFVGHEVKLGSFGDALERYLEGLVLLARQLA